MKDNENNIKKVCSFYVNDWHLTTMLLPHINNLVNNSTSIITILENGIGKNIEELLDKMNINNETKEKIQNLNWASKTSCKYSDIKNEIQENLIKQKDIEIIITGSIEYIQTANEILEKALKDIKENNITIVNCYEISKQSNVVDILNKHEFILNTSGIKKAENAI